MTQAVKKGRRKPRKSNYYASRIEELAAKHPGLREFAESKMRDHMPYSAIAREIGEKYNEKIDHTQVRRHWVRRIEAMEQRLREGVWTVAVKASALQEEARRFPGGDASKIVDTLVQAQLIEDQLRLGEADIMKLLAEERARRVLELRAAKLKGELAVSAAKLERERENRKAIAAAVEQARRGGQAQGGVNGAGDFDSKLALERISELIGAGGEAEERVEDSDAGTGFKPAPTEC